MGLTNKLKGKGIMKIFIRYILRSMTEKKSRFFLMLLSVSLSTALVFASMGLVDMVISNFTEPQIKTFEGRNIVIRSNNGPEAFYKVDSFNTNGLKENSVIKEIRMEGIIIQESEDEYVDDLKINISINGRHSEDMTGEVIEGTIEDMAGMECAISERTSKERNLSIGDYLEMTIAGQSRSLEIKAIYKTDGVFYNDSDIGFGIYVPYEYISQELGAEGKYNMVLAEAASGDVRQSIKEFNDANDDYEGEILFDEEDIYEQVSFIQGILYLMLAIVVIMSAVIIYGAFKLIITERMKTIGTFLSQGATVGRVKGILYLESGAYGLFGAVIGVGLGVVVLNVVDRFISPLSKYGIYEGADIDMSCYIAAIVFSFILPLASSYLPVRRLAKLQVKDVILNDTRAVKKMGYGKMVIGLSLVAASVIIYMLLGEKISSGVFPVFAASIAGVIMAYPKIISLLSGLIYRALRGKSKTLLFAFNNLGTSKVLLGNITLVFISLVSVIGIQSVGTSMVEVVTEAYTALDYDIQISGISTIRGDGKAMEDLVEYLYNYGLKDEDIIYYGSADATIITDGYQDGKYLHMECGEIDSYIDYMDYLDWENEDSINAVKEFKAHKNSIIISKAMAKSVGVETGDQVTISINGHKHPMKIAGVIDGRLNYNGYFAFIDLSTASELFGYRLYSLNIKTDMDTNQVIKDIKPKLREIGASFETLEYSMERNLQGNEYLLDILKVFSYLAIIIGALGIINNISISFLQRKTEFAVLSSTGMENKSRNLILLAESFLSVTWAMIIAGLYSPLGIGMISLAVNALGIAIKIDVDYGVFPIAYIVTLMIVVAATVPALFKSKKLSIIEELKYE